MSGAKAGRAILSLLLWSWVGTLYFLGEVAWKTLSHKPEAISWTMLVLAVLLAVPLERCGAELPWDMPLIGQAVICANTITAVEFAAGCVLNIWLGLDIWDYSRLPGNILGQICPHFLVLWFFLSLIGIVMLDWMRYAVEGGTRPHYRLF